MSRIIYIYLSIIFVIGMLGTIFWLHSLNHPFLEQEIFSWKSAWLLMQCVLYTLANLTIRWFRWFFLVRRRNHLIATRDSVLYFFSTLPALLVPFSVGELIRIPMIKRQYKVSTKYLVAVWLVERTFDVLVLGGVLLAFSEELSGYTMGILVAAGVICLSALWWMHDRRFAPSVWSLAFVSVVSTVAWVFPMIALAIILSGGGISYDTGFPFVLFSRATLMGGATGLPLGVSVTGSALISEIVDGGAALEAAIYSTVIFRTGTAWFAVFLGAFTILLFKRQLVRLLARRNAENHFDDIADDYEKQIPEHVRDKLLNRKIDLMERRMKKDAGIENGARGLDLGCGQGWYLTEVARRGYEMVGADRSRGQLVKAQASANKHGLNAKVAHCDAGHLPFHSNTFDFIYSINVLHHITHPEERHRYLSEVIRVLRPGGVLFLHEINTVNPLFRFYIGYLFPLIKKIDEGTEVWINPVKLPAVEGGSWLDDVEYFTFLPDFVPVFVQKLLSGLEAWLERSRFRRYSAHFMSCLRKSENTG